MGSDWMNSWQLSIESAQPWPITLEYQINKYKEPTEKTITVKNGSKNTQKHKALDIIIFIMWSKQIYCYTQTEPMLG